MADVKALGDQLVGLTVKEVNQLADYLKEEHGIEPAAAAAVSILVAPLTRGRISTIIDRVTTVVTPGSTVDVVVTDYGVAVNPTRNDLKEKFIEAGIKIVTLEELRAIATKLLGTPKEIEFTDEVVAVIEYRDGSIIDVVKKIKK